MISVQQESQVAIRTDKYDLQNYIIQAQNITCTKY